MKKKNISKLIALSLVAGMVLSVTGCAGIGKGKVVELRFHDIMPSAEREEYFKGVIEDFNAQHDNIKVTFESTPWDQAHNKLITLGSANNLPDITIMHQDWLAEFTSAEWLVTLDDYYEPWKETLTDFAIGTLIGYDQQKVFGHVYGIPQSTGGHAMFVRTDWLEEVGMTVEDLDTWEDYYKAAELMTDASKDRYGYSFRGARGGADHATFPLQGALNGKIYEEDGTCRHNYPEAVEAFTDFCDLYLKGWAPVDSINWGYAEQVQGFTSGLTGILNNNPEVIQVCEETMDPDTWTTAQFPRSADGNIYAKADSMYYSITSSCKYPEEAWEFIKFLMTDEPNAEWCELFYNIPVTRSLANDPKFKTGKMAGFIETLEDPNFVRRPTYGYFSEVTEFSETIHDQEVQRYLLGQQTAQEALDNVAAFLTEKQQAFMKENPDTPLPRATRRDGSVVE
ncbi:MAG: sugar ABC transporter substrate-binding protein [Lachnospiraceae bacterium]|nr:sugar ABC transporter substrate-binding protein [Lachnospiraceae bacterium]